ncbi:hypothetical protein IJ750_00490 [bacterium]|nr:hypothetical protein [bacterium]
MKTTEQTAVKGGPLKNLTGEYYVGMKREDAKNKSVFDKIDVNGDKKLSGREICKQRDLECAEIDRDKTKADASVDIGCFMMAAGLAAAPESGGVSLILGILGGITGLGGIIYEFTLDDADEARKETEQYRKVHKFDTNY